MRILFIKPSSLGDIVHGLQLAESLRQDLPGLSISWVAREIFAPLVQACRTVDEVFIFQRKGGLGGFFRLVGELRRQEFDWVVDLQGLFRSGLLSGLAKGGRKAGRADAREFAGVFYKERPPLLVGGQAHALDILLQFRKLFGLEPELKGQLTFASSLPDGFPAREGSSRTYLFFPESRRAEKQWPYFAQLTETLLETDAGCRIVWAGSGGVDAPTGFASDRFANLCGKTALESLPAMLAAADCILANDSGPMHLAVAMGRPVLALFGPTDPARFGPYRMSGAVSNVLEAPNGDLTELEVSGVQQALLDFAAFK